MTCEKAGKGKWMDAEGRRTWPSVNSDTALLDHIAY